MSKRLEERGALIEKFNKHIEKELNEIVDQVSAINDETTVNKIDIIKPR